MSESGEQRAVVRDVEGQLVLDNPASVAVFKAFSKRNCRNTFELNADRIEHFKKRLVERGLTAKDMVITLINADDLHGSAIVDMLMPNFNWQEIRDRGEIPFARGLATRGSIQEAVEIFDQEAATKLRGMNDLAVVVIDHGVAEIFPA
jgi:hypothetical protein